jgi:hypothetical protein
LKSLPQDCCHSEDEQASTNALGPTYVTAQAVLKYNVWNKADDLDWTLGELLRFCHFFQSGNPLDKVYAFLSMAKN